MRVIIAGGGTGGHIYPAVTIARALQQMAEPCELLFVGTKEGLEADIIPKEGFAFETIEVRGFERRISLRNLITIGKTVKSLITSWSIIKNFKPDIIIGTGGYVCGPVLLAGSFMGIPAMIQEQNVIPGVTNKILAGFVKKIAVGYNEAKKYFGTNPDKVVVTGNPIRAEVLKASRSEGIAALGLDPNKLTVLVSGGSRGARSINEAMVALYTEFIDRNDVQILHVTGQNEYNNIVGKMDKYGIINGIAGNVIIKPYLYNMPLALAAADIAIFRAGAIGLAELTARGIPSILIPYPYAAENHQEFNARVLEEKGAAAVVRDVELPGGKLKEVLLKLLSDPQKLKSMAMASREFGKPQAAEDIARLAIHLVEK